MARLLVLHPQCCINLPEARQVVEFGALTPRQMHFIMEDMRRVMLVIDDFNDLLALESFFRRIGFDVLSLGKDSLVADAMLGFIPDFVMATAKGRVVDGSKLAIRLKKALNPPVVALIYPAGQPPVLSVEAEAAIDALVEIPFQPKALLGLLADRTGIEKRGLIEKFDRLRAAKLQGLEDPNLFRDEEAQRSELKVVRGGEDFAAELISSLASTDARAAKDAVISLVEDLKGKTKPVHVSSQNSGRNSEQVAAEVQDTTQPPALTARLQRYGKFLSENDEDASGVISRADAVAAREKLKTASVGEKELLEQIDAEKRAFVRSLFDREGTEKESLGQLAGVIPASPSPKK